MQDQPDVSNGTRQPSGHIVTDFILNAAYVEAVGEPLARRTLEVLVHVAQECIGRERGVIEERLRERLTAIGVRLSDVELDSFADEISRSDRTMSIAEPNPYLQLTPF
ncbi:MAG: hypothetical protein M9891_06515 [Austwickia sp.]|nr:hypothetical protein [Austwickia sp.]MCO5308927.1 hypothetical protein [Austwickia sp.]